MKTQKQIQKEMHAVWPNIDIISQYTGANEKVTLKCKECGHTWQTTARSVINSKHGCPHCGVKKAAVENSKQKFIKKLPENFELIEFIDYEHVTVKCKICGHVRKTTANNILRFGCKQCAAKQMPQCQPKNLEDFKKEGNQIHNEKYDYSKVIYVNCKTPVKIICPIHGEFQQTPLKHISGHQGCPECAKIEWQSYGEKTINEFLKKNQIEFVREYRIINPYDENHNFRVDFYITHKNQEYIIEYNGQQHYKPVKLFGGSSKFEQLVLRDTQLQKYCEEHSIKLLTIKYNDKNIESIISQFLTLPS